MQEMLDGGRGYLTASGRADTGNLCWLFQRLAAQEEATFQQREVGAEGEPRGGVQGGVGHMLVEGEPKTGVQGGVGHVLVTA